jgi:hypothetical protein
VTNIPTNIIDHNFLLMDASSSMSGLAPTVIKVVDNQIQHLAQRTEQLGTYESRMTISAFHTKYMNLVWDMDVLRLRNVSMRDYYRPNGMTALVVSVQQTIDEAKQIYTKYGDHGFLLWVVTDGQENASGRGHYGERNGSATSDQINRLNATLQTLPENWIVACLVPDHNGMREALRFGFTKDNIQIWNPTAQGVIEVGERIQRATDSYMEARKQGVATKITRGGGIFNFDLGKLTKKDVESNLTRLTKGKDYDMLVVQDYEVIRDFVEAATGRPYHPSEGKAFYEFTKTEEVQPKKDLAIRDRNTGAVYAGKEARKMLGIPEGYYKIKPQDHPEFDLFIQSTSVNRKLQPGTNLIVMK